MSESAHVWLVFEPGGKVMAVLEDDETFAGHVAEVNHRYGWRVQRKSVWRAAEAPGHQQHQQMLADIDAADEDD